MCTKSSSHKTILVAVLNWGLGHATRSITIITKLEQQGHTVIIGSDGDALLLLQKHFPNINTVDLPSLRIQYGKNPIIQILISIPHIICWIVRDHFCIKKIVKSKKIDLIVSDNRWGCWHKNIKSIFITHQIMIKLPRIISFCEHLVYTIQQSILKPFAEILIPDIAEKETSLSGDLSHLYLPKTQTRFIGILSQFSPKIITVKPTYDVAIILSGPEPQRSMLEVMLIQKLQPFSLKIIMVGGKMSANSMVRYSDNISYIPFASRDELLSIIISSKWIICRSGYSSIMDLIVLQKKALLIPTPHQSEQEYLANHCKKNNWFATINQNEIPSLSLNFIAKVEKTTLPDSQLFSIADDITIV